MLTSVNVNSNLPLNVLFENAEISARFIEKMVIHSYPEASKMTKLLDQVSGSDHTKAWNRKVEWYRKGIEYPNAIIATATASGSNLILTFTDSTYFNFRPTEMLKAKSGVFAHVVSRSPGSVTISPFCDSSGASLSALSTATDFLAGEGTMGLGLNPNIFDSGTNPRLNYMPFQDYQWIEFFRNTAEVSSEENSQGTYIDAGDGTQYYARQVYMDSLNEVIKSQGVRMWTGVRANNGGRVMSGGLPWQIKYQGGTFRTYADLNESEAQAFINQMKLNHAQQGYEIGVLAGMGYIGQFQTNVIRGYIEPTGTRNTFGGSSVVGIDGNIYAYNAKKMTLSEDPFVSVSEYFRSEGQSNINNMPMMANAAIMIDTSATITDGGTQRWCKSHSYGPQEGMWWQPVNGLVDDMGNKSAVATNSSMSAKKEFVYSKLFRFTNTAAHGYTISNR